MNTELACEKALLFDKMAEMFIEIKPCPKEILVHDPRSFAFVKDFCDRLDIGLEFISEESQGWDMTTK